MTYGFVVGSLKKRPHEPPRCFRAVGFHNFLSWKHHRSSHCKREYRHGEAKRGQAHPFLNELTRGVGKKEHGGKEHRICEVLPGHVAGPAGLTQIADGLCPRLGGLVCAAPAPGFIHRFTSGSRPWLRGLLLHEEFEWGAGLKS
jgi:hypothetical protein